MYIYLLAMLNNYKHIWEFTKRCFHVRSHPLIIIMINDIKKKEEEEVIINGHRLLFTDHLIFFLRKFYLIPRGSKFIGDLRKCWIGS